MIGLSLETSPAKPAVLKSKQACFLLYPDSCPVEENGIVFKLIENGYCGALSPLHTPANNPLKTVEDEEKKPHYHCIVAFEHARSLAMLEHFVKETFNGTKVKPVTSRTKYTRYLCHLDNPEKEQFPGVLPHDFGGYQLQEYLLEKDPLEWLVEYIFENEDLHSIRQLTLRCMRDFRWALPHIKKNAFFLKSLLLPDEDEQVKMSNNSVVNALIERGIIDEI